VNNLAKLKNIITKQPDFFYLIVRERDLCNYFNNNIFSLRRRNRRLDLLLSKHLYYFWSSR